MLIFVTHYFNRNYDDNQIIPKELFHVYAGRQTQWKAYVYVKTTFLHTEKGLLITRRPFLLLLSNPPTLN